MNFWWVNQSKTHSIEEGKYLWAPQKNQQGSTFYHWDNVKKVMPGDLIFHYNSLDKAIIAVSAAINEGYAAKRPEAYANNIWEDNGWRVDVDVYLLKEKVFRNVISEQIKNTQKEHGPINSSNTVNQGYLFELPFESIKYILNNMKADDRDHFSMMFPSLISEIGIENEVSVKKEKDIDTTRCSKPFLLLAGISGTGKTRFVREQARAYSESLENYCIVAVRPDWHEPSDLLGYISRINGVKFVSTPFLKFIVKAWQNAYESAEKDKINLKDLNEISTFWLCLDEMNLAPVEQYFADYLSVLESREWNGSEYRSDPLLNKDIFDKLKSDNNDSLNSLRKELKIEEDDLWNYFVKNGIQLPPNLIVAGTVNMDETTHGFSRKVVDRALTIDFGEFYPNDYDEFFEKSVKNKILGFPVLSQVNSAEYLSSVVSDPGGLKSIDFLKRINDILKTTPFELAYRALNELLLSVISFTPRDDELCAVWDDFLMQKVLPRIEGDTVKLRLINNDMSAKDLEERVFGKGTLLHGLYNLLASEEMLGKVWNSKRPDLLRENINGAPVLVECRSKKKLEWMMKRLKSNHFTDFWV